MKRRILTILLVLTMLAAAGIVVVHSLQERLPAQAQAALDRYLSSENAVSSRPVAVRQVVRAIRPGRFDALFSSASIGDSFYFQTSRGYRSAAIPSPLILTTSPLPSGTSEGGRGGRALPFPPRDLWCVLLNEAGENGRVVYLALHEDLYNADWIVHEGAGAPGDAMLATRLAAVGCNLGG
jgi:hypothetical protein